MARRTSYEINYDRLKKLLSREPRELEFDRAYRFRASGFIDLVVEPGSRIPKSVDPHHSPKPLNGPLQIT